MNRRQLKIQRIILDEIKPDDCQVCFIHDGGVSQFEGIKRTSYDEINKVAIIYMQSNPYFKNITLNNQILHGLLHEVCHHLTWNKKWDRRKAKRVTRKEREWFQCNECGIHSTRSRKTKKKSKYSIREGWSVHPSYYLSEYVAEKMLRRICKIYGWHEILKASDVYISGAKDNKKGHKSDHYPYAARRIYREELLHKKNLGAKL